ncbi:hypothetical protein Celal_2845 [Cellulophaga algicola DSM 14237]|uniref:Uncharacterized protein n=1 Tax=Cellulophaga algicola (strain DSM 14237 / IC166 / ACAM 630) TaxID=688270 RepID=E6XCY3_CELAD|nr:hypothetical protein [Cellulophaga algicola]ADV50124.1 hypothetical protein Celal_2845 [Cellulophaga algicola DSM 14237]
MEYLEKVDWPFIWSIVRDTVIPHSGTLIFNTLLFLFLGFAISLTYSIVIAKKKLLKRKPKYYNWAVKLYIPIIILSFLYIFGQIGLIRGIYKCLEKEKTNIVSGIYTNTLGFAFETEEAKNNFIGEIQATAIDTKDRSDEFIFQLRKESKNHNSGYSLIDSGKNKIADYLITKYGTDIYKAGVYAMLNFAIAHAAHTNMDEVITYGDFSAAMDFLMSVGHKDIEQVVLEKLNDWFTSLLDNQYSAIIKPLYMLALLVLLFPITEFFIYKKWVEPKLLEKELAAAETQENSPESTIN